MPASMFWYPHACNSTESIGHSTASCPAAHTNVNITSAHTQHAYDPQKHIHTLTPSLEHISLGLVREPASGVSCNEYKDEIVAFLPHTPLTYKRIYLRIYHDVDVTGVWITECKAHMAHVELNAKMVSRVLC
jgi:hypothetical protein